MGEGGIALSGGQRQRLAIARSIVSQPPILILDEATSSIDIRGEKIVQAALDRVSQNRTTIMIAHRLSTVRRADKIIVMKDGTNAEEGTHEELFTKGGIYHGLVTAQQLEPLEDSTDSPWEEFPMSCHRDITSADGLISEKRIEAHHTPTRSMESMSLFQSLGTILYENRGHWVLYLLTLSSAVGAGCKYLSRLGLLTRWRVWD